MIGFSGYNNIIEKWTQHDKRGAVKIGHTAPFCIGRKGR